MFGTSFRLYAGLFCCEALIALFTTTTYSGVENSGQILSCWLKFVGDVLRDYICNTSLSSKLTNRSNKLECFIDPDWTGLPETSTLAYWTHLSVMKEMKYCELELGFVWLIGKLIVYSSRVIFTKLYLLPHLQIGPIN